VGLVLAQIFVVIVKMFVKRSRPQGTAGRIYRKLDPYSFPSGHAARAAILSILTLVMGPVAAFIAIVSWSPIMVLSRIAIGIHYVLDVIAGILLGAALAALVLGVATLVPHRF
jgi:undecaprenyl-diphosphatase